DSRDVPEAWAYEVAGQDGDHGFTSPHARLGWFRSRRPMPDDARLHTQAIAYLSDYGATRGIRQPHAAHPRMEDRMPVSLSHTLWIGGRRGPTTGCSQGFIWWRPGPGAD